MTVTPMPARGAGPATRNYAWLKLALAGFGGFIGGLCITSMFLPFITTPEKHLLNVLDGLGSFVGGYLQALTLIVLAIGLYLQNRQIAEERDAQQDQNRWTLFMMDIRRLESLCGQLTAVVFVEDSANRPPSQRRLAGLRRVAQALDKFDQARGDSIGIDWKQLSRVADHINGMRRHAEVLMQEGWRQQALVAIQDPDLRTIVGCVAWRTRHVKTMLDDALKAGVSATERDGLARVLESIHTIEVRSASGRCELTIVPADGSAPQRIEGKSAFLAYRDLIQREHFFERV